MIFTHLVQACPLSLLSHITTRQKRDTVLLQHIVEVEEERTGKRNAISLSQTAQVNHGLGVTEVIFLSSLFFQIFVFFFITYSHRFYVCHKL